MTVVKWAVPLFGKPMKKLVRIPWRLEDWSERAVWQDASIQACPMVCRKPKIGWREGEQC